jgi:hypothetical protein
LDGVLEIRNGTLESPEVFFRYEVQEGAVETPGEPVDVLAGAADLLAEGFSELSALRKYFFGDHG